MSIAPPTLQGFQNFLVANGMSNTVLPPSSTVVSTAYEVALDLVSLQLNAASPDIYTLAVYNLGADRIVNFAPDQAGQTFFGGGPPGADGQPQPPGLRQQFNIYSFQGGVVETTHDETTGTTLAVPEALKNLMLLDLQMLKTPWGRTYLGYAQMVGSLWGIS